MSKSSKHKYIYYKAKYNLYDHSTGEEAPAGALLTKRERETRFPRVSNSYFSECLPMTTDDFHWFFGFRCENGDVLGEYNVFTNAYDF